MIVAERVWRMQRLSGRVAMVLLTVALLCLFDGLRGGFLGSTGLIRLVPGERYLLSGPLPPKTERIEDFVIEGGPADGSLRLVAEGVFTGFMFGGGMWRGYLDADKHTVPGTFEIRVRDRFGEKQNPALVFSVRVYAGAEERRAASPSLVTRWVAVDPRLLAACLGALGILVGCGNFLLGRKWHSELVAHGCGEVFRMKTVEGRMEVTADMGNPTDIPEGTLFRFSHPLRGDVGYGTVVSCAKCQVTLYVRDNAQVRPGDIACPATA
jgi:hypothetical protein